ncbi:MAG TPA: S9 family peptidase [Chloroflexota bacterium]|nr:S9 family peptidase [Chloroflexota bacterium]
MADPRSAPDGYGFDRFLQARRCYGPDFSSDGTRIVFIADLTGVPQAFSISSGGGWPDQLTFTDDRVGLVSTGPRQSHLIVGTDSRGDENIQLFLLDSRLVMERLTAATSAMHPFGGWSPDGRRIAYASNARDPSVFDVIVQDLASREAQTVVYGDGQLYAEGWSPDGQRLIISRVESSANTDLYEVDLNTGDRRLLTAHDGAARFLSPSYRPGRDSLLALSDLDGEYLALREFDRRTGRWTILLEDDWDIEAFAVSPDGRRIAVVTNVAGYSELAIFDIATGQRRPVEIPRGVIARSFVGNWRDRLVWSPDGGRLAFSLTTPRTTQNIWLADPETGAAWQITHATVGGIPTDLLVDPEVVHYPSFDQRQIPAFLYRPRGAAVDDPGPAVIYVHGGPESQTRPAFDPVIQYLAYRGYIVLAPNIRGSTGYGNTYAHLDDIEHRMDAVADVKAAAEWLIRTRTAHRDRIAVMGGSYGGFVVLAALAVYPELWAAGVDLYGIANFVSFLEHTHPFRRRHRAAEYGSLEEHRHLLERISPIGRIHRITAPLFIVHGENDIRVPITEAEQVVSALRRRGVPVDFVRLSDEGHGIVRLKNKLAVYPAIAEFLDRYVRDRQEVLR